MRSIPRDEVFDGYLLQGRGGAGAPITGWGPVSFGPAPEDQAARRARLAGRDHIRTDGRVPVMVVQSETDVLGHLGYLPARQDDNGRFRLWEVAGASHCDTYFLLAAAVDSGALPVGELADLVVRTDTARMQTELPINSGPADAFRAAARVDARSTDGCGTARSRRSPPDSRWTRTAGSSSMTSGSRAVAYVRRGSMFRP